MLGNQMLKWGAPAGCYEFDYAEEEFVDLYFCYR